mmetsp:Transcript_25282/g.50625  ORF Transcript_25282/g.50625 Transcript_25282/m.50625 type:complete len:251 (+) Transcript_25282:723-1475(+)
MHGVVCPFSFRAIISVVVARARVSFRLVPLKRSQFLAKFGHQIVNREEHPLLVGVILFVFLLLNAMHRRGIQPLPLLQRLRVNVNDHVPNPHQFSSLFSFSRGNPLLARATPPAMTPALPLRQRHLLRLERRPNELVFRRGMRPKDAPNDGEPPGDPPFQIAPFAFAGRDAVDLAAQFRHVVLERAQGPAEAVVEVDDFDEGAVSEEVFGAAGGFAGDGFGGGRVVVAVVVALVALVVCVGVVGGRMLGG